MKKGILALLSLMGWMYPTLARAQFIGYVSPQTVQQQLASSLACTGAPQIFPITNIGQPQHFLTVANVAGAQKFAAEIDGVDAQGNVVRISDVLELASSGNSGSISGSGYFPKIQVQVTCTAAATFSATYSGVWGTSLVNAGNYLLGAIDKVLLGPATPANANQTVAFQTPFASSAGTIIVEYGNSATVAGSTITVNCLTQGLGGTVLTALTATTIANSASVQTFSVPDVVCPTAQVVYTSGGATTASVFVEYLLALPGRANGAGTIGSVTQGTSPWVISGNVGITGTPTVNAAQSGGWTVTANQGTSPWITSQNPVASSGNALSNSAQATLTTSVNVKASAGNLYGVFALNGAASTCWVQFINSAGAGTLGTGVVYSVPLPASTTQPVYIPPSAFALANFSSGIAVGIATTATGATPCGTGGNVVVEYF